MRSQGCRSTRVVRWCAALAALAAMLGCSGTGSPAGDPGSPPAPAPHDPDPFPPPPPAPALELPLACADLYRDDAFPTFEVEIADADWAALAEDLLQEEEIYYPIVFRHGGEVVTDAMMRLRGNNSRCGDKLQFAISFNQVDPGGRFRGLRRLDLDHGGCRLMEERLALAYLRDLGVPAPCANHARLFVNGVYYGLFVNLEHVNKDFLARNFGSEDEGNLFKSGHSLRTNEASPDLSGLEAYRAAPDVATLASLADLDAAVLEWAGEAVLPARDNYWLYGWNYYLYEHPTRGFLFIASDLDQAFPGTSGSTLPLVPASLQHPADLVLADPAWRARFDEAVLRAIDGYVVETFEARLERWWAQISAAAAADPHHVYSEERVRTLETQIRARADHLHGLAGDPASW